MEGRREGTESLVEQAQGKPVFHSPLRTQNFWTRDTPFGRYVLVTAGPVFTEEMWRLACCALQDAFSATLKPVKVRWRARRKREAMLFSSCLAPWCLVRLRTWALSASSYSCIVAEHEGKTKTLGWYISVRLGLALWTQTDPMNACCSSLGPAWLLPQWHRGLQWGRLPGAGSSTILLPECWGRVLAHPGHGPAGKSWTVWVLGLQKHEVHAQSHPECPVSPGTSYSLKDIHIKALRPSVPFSHQNDFSSFSLHHPLQVVFFWTWIRACPTAWTSSRPCLGYWEGFSKY